MGGIPVAVAPVPRVSAPSPQEEAINAYTHVGGVSSIDERNAQAYICRAAKKPCGYLAELADLADYYAPYVEIALRIQLALICGDLAGAVTAGAAAAAAGATCAALVPDMVINTVEGKPAFDGITAENVAKQVAVDSSPCSRRWVCQHPLSTLSLGSTVVRHNRLLAEAWVRTGS